MVRHDSSEPTDAEYLVIVAREEDELYAYLLHTFAGDARFRVVLDQRGDERRQPAGVRRTNGQSDERRGDSDVLIHLRRFGFAILRLIY